MPRTRAVFGNFLHDGSAHRGSRLITQLQNDPDPISKRKQGSDVSFKLTQVVQDVGGSADKRCVWNK